MALGACARAESGNEVEATSKGGWHSDRPGDTRGVTFASAAVIQQVSLSGSNQREVNNLNKPPNLT